MKKIKLILITFQQYYKVLKFDIIEIVIYDIILGLFWLKKYNLVIDWKIK